MGHTVSDQFRLVIKSKDAKQFLVQVPGLPLANCVSLGKSLPSDFVCLSTEWGCNHDLLYSVLMRMKSDNACST